MEVLPIGILNMCIYVYIILGSARPTGGIYFTCDLNYYFLHDFMIYVLGLHLQKMYDTLQKKNILYHINSIRKTNDRLIFVKQVKIN